MCIYMNNPAKSHPDPTWKDGGLGFLDEHRPQQQEQQQNE